MEFRVRATAFLVAGFAFSAQASLSQEVADLAPRLVPQQGSTAAVGELDFSPDGRQLVTGGGVAVVWDVATRSEIARLSNQNEGFPSLTFSSDGERIFTLDRTAQPLIWTWKTGETSRPFENVGSIDEIAPCEPRQLLLGTVDNRLIVWSLKDGTAIHDVAEQADPIEALAVSKDCSEVVTATSDDVTRWDVVNGRAIGSVAKPPRSVTALALSRSGDKLAISYTDGWISVHSLPIQRSLGVAQHDSYISSLRFSPDEQSVISGSEGGRAVVWNFVTNEITLSVTDKSSVGTDFIPRFRSVAFSPADPNLVATAGYGRYAILWDLETGTEEGRLEPLVNYVRSLTIGDDFTRIVVGSWDRTASLWDLSSGRLARRLRGHTAEVIDVAISPQGDRVLTSGADGTAILWDRSQGTELMRYTVEGYIESVAFLPDGTAALLGTYNNALVWDFATNTILQTLPDGLGPMTSVAVSPNAKFALTGSTQAKLWDLESGALIRVFGNFEFEQYTPGAVVMSKSGKIVVTGSDRWLSGNYAALVWDVETGDSIARLEGESEMTAISSEDLKNYYGHTGYVLSAAVSSDDRLVVTGSADGIAIVWDLETHLPRLHLIGHTADILAVEFSPDGRYVFTGARDGTSAIWDSSTGDRIATLVSFSQDDWAVFDRDGRFDSSNPEMIVGLKWIVPDAATQPLSPEIFMRDYFEPGLLGRLLECREAESNGDSPAACAAAFEPVRPLVELNRIQPDVRIVSVRAGDTPEVALVEVEVAEKDDASQPNGKTHTGVYDLRLFRHGQLAGQWPPAAASGDGANDLDVWRRFSQVVVPEGESVGRHVFEVRLAARDKGTTVTFTSYAFNEDRVKSATATDAGYVVPEAVSTAAPKAFVVTVGVNAYENPIRNLSFAAVDAMSLSSVLQAIDGYEVVPITLISDVAHDAGGQGSPAIDQATKGNIRAVLELLAGRGENERERLRGVLDQDVDALSKATPDDVVIVTFSSHGYTDKQGRFYLLPSDSGTDETVTDHTLPKLISSEELTAWLRDIDAGDLVMIVDACFSAAGVPAGFKPGPMGDQGLGQLAYDKGMQILAATQAEDVALESGVFGQGLLTYALVEALRTHEGGPPPSDADGDDDVSIGEWLRYAQMRVPELYAQLRDGTFVPRPAFGPDQPDVTNLESQTPALFDFEPEREEVVLRMP